MAVAINEHYVVDKKGNPISVILDIDVYHRVLEELEELAAIRAYDAAKASDDEMILGREHQRNPFADGMEMNASTTT